MNSNCLKLIMYNLIKIEAILAGVTFLVYILLHDTELVSSLMSIMALILIII